MPKDYDDFIYNLVSGTTFFFEGKSGDVSHFQVILNTEINNHTKLLFLSVSTTQISGRERFITSRNFDPRTLVIVEPGEVSFLPKRSGFHCNDPLPYDSYDLYGEYISGNLKYKGVLPQKIWTRF